MAKKKKRKGTLADKPLTLASKANVKTIAKSFKKGSLKLDKLPLSIRTKASGRVEKAASIDSGETRILMFKDADGVNMVLDKVDPSQMDGESSPTLKDVIGAAMEQPPKGFDIETPRKIIIMVDSDTDTGAITAEIEGLPGNLSPRIQVVKKGTAAGDFRKMMNRLEQSKDGIKKQQELETLFKTLDKADQFDLANLKDLGMAQYNSLRSLIDEALSGIEAAKSTGRNKDKNNQPLEELKTSLVALKAKVTRLESVVKNRATEKLNQNTKAKNELSTPPSNATVLQKTPEAGQQANKSGVYVISAPAAGDGTPPATSLGFFKPESQEAGAIQGKDRRGDGAVREVVARKVADDLGLSVVPKTRLLGMDNPEFSKGKNGKFPDSAQSSQVGSYQETYANASGDLGQYMSADSKAPIQAFRLKDVQEVALLDIITMNGDRHRGNLLIRPNGEMGAIDNGELGASPLRMQAKMLDQIPLNGSVWAWADLGEANQPFSPDLKDKIARLDPDQHVTDLESMLKDTGDELASVTGKESNPDPLPLETRLLIKYSVQLLKEATAANLSPAQVESLFNKRNEAREGTDRVTAKNAGGGEFTKLLIPLMNSEGLKKANATDNLPDISTKTMDDLFDQHIRPAIKRLSKKS